jgi:hypothetical protein
MTTSADWWQSSERPPRITQERNERQAGEATYYDLSIDEEEGALRGGRRGFEDKGHDGQVAIGGWNREGLGRPYAHILQTPARIRPRSAPISHVQLV